MRAGTGLSTAVFLTVSLIGSSALASNFSKSAVEEKAEKVEEVLAQEVAESPVVFAPKIEAAPTVKETAPVVTSAAPAVQVQAPVAQPQAPAVVAKPVETAVKKEAVKAAVAKPSAVAKTPPAAAPAPAGDPEALSKLTAIKNQREWVSKLQKQLEGETNQLREMTKSMAQNFGLDAEILENDGYVFDTKSGKVVEK